MNIRFQARTDTTRTFVYSAIAVLSLGLYGCGAPSNSESTPQSKSSVPATGHNEHGDHDHDEQGDHEAHGLSDMEKMKMELSKHSPADAASAVKQLICPVSGEMIGTMGAPIMLDVNGQQVWICCEGCRKRLLENPDEYLAKLKS